MSFMNGTNPPHQPYASLDLPGSRQGSMTATGVKSAPAAPAVSPPTSQTVSQSLEVADRVGRSKTQAHAPVTVREHERDEPHATSNHLQARENWQSRGLAVLRWSTATQGSRTQLAVSWHA